jgi:hypothetical protein
MGNGRGALRDAEGAMDSDCGGAARGKYDSIHRQKLSTHFDEQCTICRQHHSGTLHFEMYISAGTGTQKLHTLGTKNRLCSAPCADSWTQPGVHFVPLIDGIKKTSQNIRGNYGLSHGCQL